MLELLQQNAALAVAAAALLGLVVGSFLNVVIHRLPIMLEREWRLQCREVLALPRDKDADEPYDLVRPASRCPSCARPIRAWENIPLISYLLLRARCPGCGMRISARYPIVEAATALLSALVIWHFGATVQGLAALGLTWTLIALTVIDFDHQLLPDNLTLPLLWVGLLLSVWGVFTDPVSAILGAAAGYGALWAVYRLFKAVTGKEGMGHGDFKLLGALGAWLGWQYLPAVIILSSAVGAVVGIALILALGRDRQVPIPFGPYLATAGFLALLWGEEINRAYLRWVGIMG
ncbi:prepilin peptidase [Ectothiorhodospiraceae bacterium 2226]|nr:prepilin peptidase [Ectothiorhodospiraceae bacterium 2226]